MINGYLKLANRICDIAGQRMLKSYSSAEIEERDSSVHTKYDIAIDKEIKDLIGKSYPSHSFLSEETGWIKKDHKSVWIIDSIDGTGNYINHNPFFAISVALWINGRPALGMIEAPFLRERYLAVRGQGAYLIDRNTAKKKKMKVSNISRLADASVLFCGGHRAESPRMLKVINQLYPKAMSLKKLGSAGIELAWVACGRAEAFILPQAYLWDIAAGILLVKEAGGRILDFSGQPYDCRLMLNQETIDFVAANRKVKLPRKINY